MVGRGLPWPWLAVAAAAMAPWALPCVPSPAFIAGLGACGATLMLARPARWSAACLLVVAWTMLAAHHGRADRLPAERAGQVVEATGTVVGLPERLEEGLRFRFRPDRGAEGGELPRQVRVGWYRDAPDLRAGQRWRLTLRVQPPRAPVNFAGHDGERWLFAERIGALGSARAGRLLDEGSPSIHRWRERLRDHVARRWAERPEVAGLLTGLIVGDRSALTTESREMLVATGTGHLLAISGLHVGLAGAGGYWLGRGLAPLAPRVLHAGRLAWPAALAGATLYALLAGFGVSTQRALVMLAVIALGGLARRRVAPERAFLLALLTVLALEPRAPLQAGFWLSFGAVFVLGWLFRPALRPRGALRTLLLAQVGLGLCMMPLVLAWGFPVAPSGLVANLLAVPAVSVLVVPLALAGAVAHVVSNTLGDALLGGAGHVLSVLSTCLGGLAAVPALAPREAVPPTWLAGAAALGAALVLFSPIGARWRIVAVLALFPLWAGRPAGSGRDGAAIDVLDVGQGTAVMLTQGREALLYDTGPGQPGRWDRVGSVIAPMLRAAGHAAPDRVFVSHGDLDHAGGLAALRERWPRVPVHARLRDQRPGLLPCVTGLRGVGDRLRFSARHPGPALPYLGNDSSCVVSVQLPHGSVLLPGDVGTAAEARLVIEGLGAHEFLLVPHHGSRSSSSEAFLAAVRPRLALVTAGAGNRFGFPHADVVDRYRAEGARVVDTGACGGIRVRLRPNGLHAVRSARRERAAPWRWPAAPGCP